MICISFAIAYTITDILVDIMLDLCIFCVMFLLVISLIIKRIIEFPVFPKIVMFLIILYFSVSVFAINPLGESFTGNLVRIISVYIPNMQVHDIFLILISIYVFITIQLITLRNTEERMSEAIARFDFDIMLNEIIRIETNLCNGSITTEQALKQKAMLQKERDLLNPLGGDFFSIKNNLTLFSYTLKLNLYCCLLIMIIGPFRDILNPEVILINEILTCIYFNIWDCVFFQLSMFVLLLIVNQIIKHYCFNIKNINENDLPEYLISIELGFDLYALINKNGERLLGNIIHEKRKEIANKYNLMIPHVRISGDCSSFRNQHINKNEYCIKLYGIEKGFGELNINKLLCIHNENVKEKIEGEEIHDPIYGLPSIWINPKQRMEAEQAGYSIFSPEHVIAAHFISIIEKNNQLFNYDAWKNTGNIKCRKYPPW